MANHECQYQGCFERATRKLEVLIGPSEYDAEINLCEEHYVMLAYYTPNCTCSMEIRFDKEE